MISSLRSDEGGVAAVEKLCKVRATIGCPLQKLGPIAIIVTGMIRILSTYRSCMKGCFLSCFLNKSFIFNDLEKLLGRQADAKRLACLAHK